MSARDELRVATDLVGSLRHCQGAYARNGLADTAELCGRSIAVIGQLAGLVEMLIAEPMTPEEAEVAFDALPELSPEDRAAMASIDIKKILRMAGDPLNATPDGMVRTLVEAAGRSADFDPAVLGQARAWMDNRYV